MKVVVVSGDDREKARRRYVQIIAGVKKKKWEVVGINPTLSLAEQLVSTGLFTSDILYSIDGVNKTSPAELKWLGKNSDTFEGSLLIYADGKLPALLKKVLPKNTKFETFETPQVVWRFLDSFYPGNGREAIRLFEELAASEALELTIAMLARHLRDLCWVSEGAKGMNVQAWRMSKLGAQARKFTKEGLVDTIDALADIDYKSKTSDFDARLGLTMMIAERLV